jgi:hypothetical protein
VLVAWQTKVRANTSGMIRKDFRLGSGTQAVKYEAIAQQEENGLFFQSKNLKTVNCIVNESEHDFFDIVDYGVCRETVNLGEVEGCCAACDPVVLIQAENERTGRWNGLVDRRGI